MVAGLVIWWVLAKTWWGRTVRATAQDPMAAKLIGIDPDQVYRLAFGLGVGLTAFGGAIILPYLTVSPSAGEQFGVLMFTVVVLGGLGSVWGAYLGGLIVGIVESLAGYYIDPVLRSAVWFLIFLVVLIVRPAGLLGQVGAEEVGFREQH